MSGVARPAAPVVVKFGGELIEDPSHLAHIVSAIASGQGGAPLVIVHGGGREIDAALKVAGIPKQQVDGLRVTDAATLDVVVAVLAGAVNTRFVAALVAAGVRAVGLTGADAACGLSIEAPAHRASDGRTVDLGRVGLPAPDADVTVVSMLAASGFVPVIASIGIGRDGRLLNVNADTFAAHVAERLGAARLVIAGTTAGVLREDGGTLRELDAGRIEQLVSAGTATAGMIAKLRACSHALASGVGDVLILDGRDVAAIKNAMRGDVPDRATRISGVGGHAASQARQDAADRGIREPGRDPAREA